MILSIIGVLLAALLAKIILKYIKVYRTLMQYKGKGVKIDFNFGPGYIMSFKKNLQKYNDMFYLVKNYHVDHPEAKLNVFNRFGSVVVRILDPEYARDHFKNISTNYQKFQNDDEAFYYEFGSSLLLSSGKVWKKHRKLTSSLFHFEMLKQRTPDVLILCNQVFGEMESNGLQNVDLLNTFQSITGQMVGRLFFGADFNQHTIMGKSATDFVAEYTTFLGSIGLNPVKIFLGLGLIKRGFTSTGKKYVQYKKAFDEFKEKFMKTKKAEYEAKKKSGDTNFTMIDLFFKQREDTPHECYDDKEIIDEFTTFFVAGMDTTGHLLIMTVYYLLQNPEELQKVIDEVSNVFGSSDETFINENLNKLDYMHAVFKEALRMATPAVTNFVQIATNDHQIGQTTIKKGTQVFPSYLTMNYSPLYHEDPNTFKPDRWIDENSKTFKSIKDHSYLFTPFSSGPRNCIGQHLALIEAKTILSRLLQKYTIEMADKDYVLKMKFGFLYEPQDPILINLKPKQ